MIVSTSASAAVARAARPSGDATTGSRPGNQLNFKQSIANSQQATGGKKAADSRHSNGKSLPSSRSDGKGKDVRYKPASANVLSGTPTVVAIHLPLPGRTLDAAVAAKGPAVRMSVAGQFTSSKHLERAQPGNKQLLATRSTDGKTSQKTPKLSIEMSKSVASDGVSARRVIATIESAVEKFARVTGNASLVRSKATALKPSKPASMTVAVQGALAASPRKPASHSNVPPSKIGSRSGTLVWHPVGSSAEAQLVRRPLQMQASNASSKEGSRKGKTGSVSSDQTGAFGSIPPASGQMPHVSQPHSSVATSGVASVSSPQDFSDLLSHHMVMMVAHGRQEALLHLSPAQLGTVQVHLSTDQHSINAVFISPQANVRQALEAAMPSLRQALAQQGLSLAGGFVSDQSYSGSSGREPPRYRNAVSRSSDSLQALISTAGALFDKATTTRYISRGVSVYV